MPVTAYPVHDMTSGDDPSARSQWLRRPEIVAPLVLVVLVLMMVIGGRLPRSETVGSYRPTLEPPAFAGECNPFPAGFELDLGYQVRADRMITPPGGEQVRRLDLHYDLVDEDTARRHVELALAEAGFVQTPSVAGDDPEIEEWYRLASYGRVGVTLAAFPGVDDQSIVRGALSFDLPPSTLTPSVAESCDDPVQTKRFPEYTPGGSSG